MKHDGCGCFIKTCPPPPRGVGGGRVWKLVRLSAMPAAVAIPRNKKKINNFAFYPAGISGAL